MLYPVYAHVLWFGKRVWNVAESNHIDVELVDVQQAIVYLDNIVTFSENPKSMKVSLSLLGGKHNPEAPKTFYIS